MGRRKKPKQDADLFIEKFFNSPRPTIRIKESTPLGRRKEYPDEMLRERFEALTTELTRHYTPGSKTKFGPTLEPFSLGWWRHGLDELVELGFTLPPRASYPESEIAKWSGPNPPKGGVMELAYFLFTKRHKISRSKVEKLPRKK